MVEVVSPAAEARHSLLGSHRSFLQSSTTEGVLFAFTILTGLTMAQSHLDYT